MIRNFIILLVAIVLGCVLLLPFALYTILFYRHEESKQSVIFITLAIMIDIAGNVVGLPIYHIIAKHKDGNTLFCLPKVTISASIGHLILTGNINKKGLWISNILNKAFQEPTHCVSAYQLYLKQNSL